MEGKLNSLSKRIFEQNCSKGFWDEGVGNRNFGEIIALIHSELSEALEADRSNLYAQKDMFQEMLEFKDYNSEGFKGYFEQFIKNTKEDELADTVIRILDYCGAKNIDIEWHIKYKLEYNNLRDYKHGKKY